MSALNDQVGGRHYKDLEIQPAVYTHKNKMIGQACDIIKRVTVYLAGIDADPEELNKAIHSINMTLEIDGHSTQYIRRGEAESITRDVVKLDRHGIIRKIVRKKIGSTAVVPTKDFMARELMDYGFNMCEIVSVFQTIPSMACQLSGNTAENICTCIKGAGFHTRLCEIHNADKADTKPEEDR